MSSQLQNRSNDLIESSRIAYQRTYDLFDWASTSTIASCAKIPSASVAGSDRLTSHKSRSVSSFESDCSVPPLNVPVVKVQDCPEEFDETRREAKFAFRSTNLGSLENSESSARQTSSPSSSSSGEANTNSDPAPIQHWTGAIHFPRGNLTFVFEAAMDRNTGLLEAFRARHVDYIVFEKAKYFGTADTSPRELLELAKQVSSNGTPYSVTTNNCQTWLKQFLQLISPDLCQSFDDLQRRLNRQIGLGLMAGASSLLIGGSILS